MNNYCPLSDLKQGFYKRPHKDFASFQSEDSQNGDPTDKIPSDTEASGRLWAGAACIAHGIRAVENKKSLCSLDFLVLLGQAKSTNRKCCGNR